MTGKRIKKFVENPKKVVRLQPGYHLAPHDKAAALIKLSEQVKQDWYEVYLLPGIHLLERYFSAYVCHLGGLDVKGYGKQPPRVVKTKIEIEEVSTGDL